MQDLPRKHLCPLLKDKSGNPKPCIGLDCNWFIQIRGQDPNTGKDVDHWSCAIAWLPTLLINTANETRQAAAATESMRNEMVGAAHATIQAIHQAAEDKKPRIAYDYDIKTIPTIKQRED
jgi:hypothetical protein